MPLVTEGRFFSVKVSFVKRGGFYCPISFSLITNVPIALPVLFIMFVATK